MEHGTDCVIDYWDVTKFIEVEGYKKSPSDGYWYAVEHLDLADALFKMLDGDHNGDINMRWALYKCKSKNWVPKKMSQQTADLYKEILTGTETLFGCFRREGKDCVVSYKSVLQYIVHENYQ